MADVEMNIVVCIIGVEVVVCLAGVDMKVVVCIARV